MRSSSTPAAALRILAILIFTFTSVFTSKREGRDPGGTPVGARRAAQATLSRVSRRRPPNYKWWALSCTSLGMLLAATNSGTLIIALPDLERSLHTTCSRSCG